MVDHKEHNTEVKNLRASSVLTLKNSEEMHTLQFLHLDNDEEGQTR